jgi:bis(5'-nucleosyl)-tetraphosphatase (symmetrical)
MISQGRAGVWLTALRVLPLTIAWASNSRPSLRTSSRTACEAGCHEEQRLHCRTYNTAIDAYFNKTGELPLPRESHVVLPVINENQNRKRGVLVIGDVHGCYEELLALHDKAVKRNDGMPFQYVILVGDLVNKGPHSARVVRHVRSMASSGWLSVRGNHDNGALKAALGDPSRRAQKKYEWVFDANDPLSDDDVQWMADLPYTIRLTGGAVGRVEDTIIVHAGLIPGKDIQAQSIADIITLRDVVLEKQLIDSSLYYGNASGGGNGQRRPWASVWSGPEFVIFGHDAKRGIQDYEMALGLDTGACYGKMLTGVILPEGRLVHVHSARVYSPIGEKD